jgi:HD-GYP domain-containing protein (c-di-GMP phosphodiesterase class II)
MRHINKELWLLLSLFAIAAALNSLSDAQRMILALYFLPMLYSAYHYGRRHATLTAFACVFLVVGLAFFNPALFGRRSSAPGASQWFEIALWGGTLVVTGYAMGTLHERNRKSLLELQQSYSGMVAILQKFLSNEKYSNSHSYRVSVCATRIGEALGLNAEKVEQVRAAALLRNVNELGISNEVLMKAADITREEVEAKLRASRGTSQSRSSGGSSLSQAIEIAIAREALTAGRLELKQVPLETHILIVADAYESLTNGNEGKPVSPAQAQEAILSGKGKRYDARVVEAFVQAFGLKARGSAGGLN